LGAAPDAGFTNTIVQPAAETVDVTDDSDRQRRLCSSTTSLRRSPACRYDGGLSRFALADPRVRAPELAMHVATVKCSGGLAVRDDDGGSPSAGIEIATGS
jgi:hypothetical protein